MGEPSATSSYVSFIEPVAQMGLKKTKEEPCLCSSNDLSDACARTITGTSSTANPLDVPRHLEHSKDAK